MALSEYDWQRLEKKIDTLRSDIKRDTAEHLKTALQIRELESATLRKQAIETHEEASFIHNPKKGLGLIVLISAAIAGLTKLFHMLITLGGEANKPH